jgi:hypothetical protein
MTTGTTVDFVCTAIIVLVAIVGAIWLETRMAPAQERRLAPQDHPLPIPGNRGRASPDGPAA